MARTFTFELVSPERLLMSQDVEMAVVPGADGTFGVLGGHAPLTSTVLAGIIDVYEKRGSAPEKIFVAGGFAEVTQTRCTVLAEVAMPVSEIDAAQAQQDAQDVAQDLEKTTAPAERAVLENRLTVARAKARAATA